MLQNRQVHTISIFWILFFTFILTPLTYILIHLFVITHTHRMELAKNREHFYSPNDVNLVIISFQIVKNRSCHMMPKYFAVHSHQGMEIISLRPVKVSSFYPIFIITCDYIRNTTNERVKINKTHSTRIQRQDIHLLSKGQFICICAFYETQKSRRERKRRIRRIRYAVYFDINLILFLSFLLDLPCASR